MAPRTYLLFIGVVLSAATHVAARAVSHEDIRDAILSVVRMFRELTDKLERHEFRERQLGEQLKKALSALDKRERQQDILIQRLLTDVGSIQRHLSPSQEGNAKELYTMDSMDTALQQWLEGVEGRLGGTKLVAYLADMETRLLPKVEAAASEAAMSVEAIRALDAKINGGLSSRENNLSTTRLEEISARTDTLQTQIEAVRKEVTERADLLFSELIAGFQHMNNEFQVINKVEQLVVSSADSIMDTKRRVDYGVHQVVLEVGEAVRSSISSTETKLSRRLDVLQNELETARATALSNLTSGVENQIAQVWRQMGIMYKELSASAGALDSLQKHAEQYANASAATLDGMQGKVGAVAGRMDDVDENLNFLIGRLSLVSHEFNLTKAALSRALDDMRASFKQVREKATDPGPGPVPISSEADNSLP